MLMKRFAALAASLLFALTARLDAQIYRPAMEKLTLDNGLKVILHRDTAAAVVSVNIAYHAGSSRDPKGRFGLANVCGSLLFGGTKDIPPAEVYRLRAAFNAKTACVTNVDWTNLYSVYPAQFLDSALWIEADRMRAATNVVSKQQMDAVVGQVVKDLRARSRSTTATLDAEIFTEMYPAGHPYRHTSSGDTLDLARITPAEAEAFMRRHFVAENASITIGGNFDPAAAGALVRKHFAAVPSGAAMRWGKKDKSYQLFDAASFIKEDDDAAFSQLQIVFPSAPLSHPDEPAMQLIAKLLAGSGNGRLQRDLFGANPYVLAASASSNSMELDGNLWLTIRCRPEANLQSVYDRVMNVIGDTRENPVSPVELRMARNASEMSFLTPLERLSGFGGMCDVLNLANMYTGDPFAGFALLDKQGGLTEDALRRAAKRYLDPAHHLVVCVLPSGGRHLAVTKLR